MTFAYEMYDSVWQVNDIIIMMLPVMTSNQRCGLVDCRAT